MGSGSTRKKQSVDLDTRSGSLGVAYFIWQSVAQRLSPGSRPRQIYYQVTLTEPPPPPLVPARIPYAHIKIAQNLEATHPLYAIRPRFVVF